MTGPHDRALEIHNRYRSTFDSISNNSDLSDDGKIRRLAPAYVAYRDELARLQSDTQAATAHRVQSLSRAAFGVPTDPIAAMSYRDALGRAEQIDDPRVAEMKLRQALETGDDLMAQAVARHASESGWNDVLDSYLSVKPAAGQAMQELQQIQAQEANLQAKFMSAAHYMPSKPSELSRMQEHQIEALASTDTET